MQYGDRTSSSNSNKKMQKSPICCCMGYRRPQESIVIDKSLILVTDRLILNILPGSK